LQDFKAKIHQIRFRLGSGQDPAGAAYSAHPDPWLDLSGYASNDRKRREGEWKGTKRRGLNRGSIRSPIFLAHLPPAPAKAKHNTTQHRERSTEGETDLPHEAVVVAELDLRDADNSTRVRTEPRAADDAARCRAPDAVVPQTGQRRATDLQPFTANHRAK